MILDKFKTYNTKDIYIGNLATFSINNKLETYPTNELIIFEKRQFILKNWFENIGINLIKDEEYYLLKETDPFILYTAKDQLVIDKYTSINSFFPNIKTKMTKKELINLYQIIKSKHEEQLTKSNSKKKTLKK